MDPTIAIPHDKAGWIRLALAVILGYSITYLPKLVTWATDLMLGRKKQASELDLQKAENARLTSEAQHQHLQNVVVTGKAISAMLDSVESVTARFERLQVERDHWEQQARQWEARARVLEVEVALAEKNLDPFISIGKPHDQLKSADEKSLLPIPGDP